MPNALLVYPEFPPSYWSEKYAIKFVRKKAALPPLGLLTVAALFPNSYQIRVVDMNVSALKPADLAWCDAVFISAMIAQSRSFHEVVRLCTAAAKPVIAGGPYPTSFSSEMNGVSHIILGEAELIISQFFNDFERGEAKKFYGAPASQYSAKQLPDLSQSSPLPRYDLINVADYASLSVQFSRGCPYNCEFCDITALFGRRTRSKSNKMLLDELQLLYDYNWRGSVFFVDDNFIGNRARVQDLLPLIEEWQRKRGFPFTFYTEASVNLSEMPELMEAMSNAGFDMVFLGIETPNPSVLRASRKLHNIKPGNAQYLSQAVRRIQEFGMEVSGGFILGLDGDDESSFKSQFDFIQQTGIATAMVGLLCALRGTDLYARLKTEGRLLQESSGDNVSIALNFVPQMNPEKLVAGYKNLLSQLYDRNLCNYFDRCFIQIQHWKKRAHTRRKLDWAAIRASLRSFRVQLLSRQGPAYLKFITKVLLYRPKMLPEGIRLAIMGYHYEIITRQQLLVHDFKQFAAHESNAAKESFAQLVETGSKHISEAELHLQPHVRRVLRMYRKINKDFRCAADEALKSFRESVSTCLDAADCVTKPKANRSF